MVYISGDEVKELLDMEGCIKLMRSTLKDLSAGNATQVLRVAMEIGPGKILGVMPAAINSAGIAGSKVITVFPGNFNKGLPSHQGAVVLFEMETGALKAIVDGDAITAIRTAAVSAAATDALALKDASVLAILGSGLQARQHVYAISLVRDIKEVRVWDINKKSLESFKEEIEKKHNIPVIICEDAALAVNPAHIICTVTSAKEPVLMGRHIKEGAHINAVGACSPVTRELDSEAILKGRIFCDLKESLLAEAGDFLIPLNEGLITKEHLLGEVGQVILGQIEGRKSDKDITVFESLGLAAEDLMAADYILKSKERGA